MRRYLLGLLELSGGGMVGSEDGGEAKHGATGEKGGAEELEKRLGEQ